MVELKFRNFVTLLIMGALIGGSGIAIVYDGTLTEPEIETRTTDSDGTVTETYRDRSLDNSQVFNIWLGAVLGYGGAIIAVLYKAKKADGTDDA